MRRFRTILPAMAVLISAGIPCMAESATLYRDMWGVPHVYADTLGAAAYAVGYAQAEDRLEDIYINVRTATGTMSEAFGPQYIEQDYAMKLARNAERCEEYWRTAPAYLTALGNSFMRGVEAYVAEHPERKPLFATELAGWQCMAIPRTMVMQWTFDNLKNELSRKKAAPGIGSNSFAVSATRSAEGCPIFMADPHLYWKGMAVFYEARVHADKYGQCGFWLVGSPMPIMGHTTHVAWAMTIGGPDTSDVYRVKVNPENPLQYRYNGEWRDFDAAEITVAVKDQPSVKKPALFSVHGPVLEEPDTATGIAYCGASPYFDATGSFEESYRLATALSCEEFYQGLAMNELMEVNVMFADTAGNIQYVRTGRTPIRPEGDYNWAVPVPGDSEKTRWLGIHGIDDLVQTKNPPQGYYQNCNVSPAFMMKGSSLTPDKYRSYIYNVSWDSMTPRGERLLELVSTDASVTKKKAMDYAVDVYDILASKWQNALKAAIDVAGSEKMADPEFAGAVGTILAWDGQFTKESAAAPIVKFWRMKCDKDLPVLDIANGKPLGEADQVMLLEKLSEALAEMKAKYGKLNILWGDINLIGRGGKYFACPGVELGGWSQKAMTETVFDVGTSEAPEGSGRYIADNGSSAMLLSILRPDGIESYSLVNWGQSGNPDSPHYLDQAEILYSQRKFKPTWFKKEDLLQHLESEKTLAVK